MDHATRECDRCGIHLPLKVLPEDGDEETEWICSNCGLRMSGALDPNSRPAILNNAYPVETESFVSFRRRVNNRKDYERVMSSLLDKCLSGARFGT